MLAAASSLVELLPEGTSVAAVIVTVILFLRQQAAIAKAHAADRVMQNEKMERMAKDCHTTQEKMQAAFLDKLDKITDRFDKQVDRIDERRARQSAEMTGELKLIRESSSTTATEMRLLVGHLAPRAGGDKPSSS